MLYHPSMRLLMSIGLLLSAGLTFAGEAKWWKGNLHTHTLWSDGDDYPEMVAAWYKEQGYHFLALSDHNITLTGQKWITLTNNKGGAKAFSKYVDRLGNDWIEQRTVGGTQQVRLKTLIEFRRLVEEPGRFLMIPSEEITDQFNKLPIHLNASNLREYIPPQKGSNVLDVLQRNVDAVFAQRQATGQPMFPHINHPNFGWALTIEDVMHVSGDRFFEIYNGHPQVHNYGKEGHPGMERMWDVALSFRLTDLGLGIMYGVGVDDAHNYHTTSIKDSNPGRGWVVVRAPELTAPALIDAMERGDFYASSGVRLKDVRVTKRQLIVEIEAEKGVAYTIQFIGTRKNFDRRSEPVVATDKSRVSRKYSDDIGQVLLERKGKKGVYRFRGDEIYVRAKVISSKPKKNPYAVDEKETAWVQPVVRN